jgi:hypothetical protein
MSGSIDPKDEDENAQDSVKRNSYNQQAHEAACDRVGHQVLPER